VSHSIRHGSQAGTVNIVHSRTFLTKGEALIKSPKTAAGKRKITIPQRMMANLEHHLCECTENGQESFLIIWSRWLANCFNGVSTRVGHRS
jgi:hypothetical protein